MEYTILQNSARHHKFKAKTEQEAIDYFKKFIMKEKYLYENDTFRLVRHIAKFDVDESKIQID